MTLVTHQTGPEGKKVQRLLIEETLPIARELYLGMVLDRAVGRNGLHGLGCRRHGDRRGRRQRSRTPSSRNTSIRGFGLQPFQAREIAFGLGLEAEVHQRGGEVHAGPGTRR